MKSLIKASVIALAAIIACSHADAATFKPIKKGKSLVMTGDIVPGDDARLRNAYTQACSTYGHCPERVFLNSPGGRIDIAIDVGSMIYKLKLDTVVGKTDVCASACFLIWAAGEVRVYFATSSIGVHGSRDLDGHATHDTDRAVADFMRAIGVPNVIIDKMLQTPPTDMAWLTYQDVAGWAKSLK